jgi:hypothetical protein
MHVFISSFAKDRPLEVSYSSSRQLATDFHMSTQKNSSFAPGPITLAIMIVLAALSRLLPHPPNFSPVEAMALFAGAYFAKRWIGILMPLAAMLISDIALGLINGGLYLEHFTSLPFLLVYACITLSSLMGFGMRGKVNTTRVLGYSLVGSIIFFLVTNFGVYLTASAMPGSEACVAGIIPCYVSAIPFFQWTVLGTLFYSILMFGGFALLRIKLPNLQAQTV